MIIKQDDQLTVKLKLLVSINGIKDETAWALLAYIGDISLFENSK
jgi:transposase